MRSSPQNQILGSTGNLMIGAHPQIGPAISYTGGPSQSSAIFPSRVPPPPPPSYSMPGAFIDFEGEQSNAQPLFAGPGPLTLPPPPLARMQNAIGSGLEAMRRRLTVGDMSIPEFIRASAIMRHQLTSATLSWITQGNLPIGASGTPHNGYSGEPEVIDLTGTGASPYSRPLPSRGGLGDIIQRTSNFDYANMLDNNGNPLQPRLMNLFSNISEDSVDREEQIRDLLANIRPDLEIPEEERGQTPEALKYPLYVHQQVALKWMTEMEEGTYKGGILADEMGLGKTISTLALIVSRRAPDDEVKTNIVVSPVALCRQWEREISKKLRTRYALRVHIQHGRRLTYNELKRYDVVLVTYGTLTAEDRRYANYLEEKEGDENFDPAKDKMLQAMCPILHPLSKFHRVILDEAQCIKNRNTQQSKAVDKIRATYRWCLTGTPMMNSVEEIYPLLRFLDIKPYCDFAHFQKVYSQICSLDLFSPLDSQLI
jgi:hypothetical protein